MWPNVSGELSHSFPHCCTLFAFLYCSENKLVEKTSSAGCFCSVGIQAKSSFPSPGLFLPRANSTYFDQSSSSAVF